MSGECMIQVTCVCPFSCRQIEANENTPLAHVLSKIKEAYCNSSCGVTIRNRDVGEDILAEPIGRFTPDGMLKITRLCDPVPFIGNDGVADELFQTYPCVNNVAAD